jgi:hypothetical protein
MIRGVGPVYAKKLVRAFGEDNVRLVRLRAREGFQHPFTNIHYQIASPLEALCAFGGGRKDRKSQQGRYPTTPLVTRREI